MIALFPEFLALNIGAVIPIVILFGLLVAGYAERRKGYIGRIAIFLNSLLLWQIFYRSFLILPAILQIYLNIGSLFGVIALLSYIPKKSLPTEFYKIAYYLYGSLSIIIAIVGSIYFKIPIF